MLVGVGVLVGVRVGVAVGAGGGGRRVRRTGRRGRAGRRVGRRLRSTERIDVMQIAAGVLVTGQHYQAGRAVHVLLGRGRVVELGVERILEEQLAVPIRKPDVVHVRHFAVDIASALGRGAEDVDLRLLVVEQQDRAGVIIAAPIDDEWIASCRPSAAVGAGEQHHQRLRRGAIRGLRHRVDADAIALEFDVDMVVGG